MARKRQGGKREPKEPAAVSGPRGLSQRTDGKQPVRVAPAEFHGQRQALENQQAAAPLPAVQQPGSDPLDAVGPANPGMEAELNALRDGIFAPTRGEAPDMEIDPGAAAIRDTEMMLRVLYERFPHPDIGRLLPRG